MAWLTWQPSSELFNFASLGHACSEKRRTEMRRTGLTAASFREVDKRAQRSRYITASDSLSSHCRRRPNSCFKVVGYVCAHMFIQYISTYVYKHLFINIYIYIIYIHIYIYIFIFIFIFIYAHVYMQLYRSISSKACGGSDRSGCAPFVFLCFCFWLLPIQRLALRLLKWA